MPNQYKNNYLNQDYNSQSSVNMLHANIVPHSFPLSLVLLVLKAGFPYFLSRISIQIMQAQGNGCGWDISEQLHTRNTDNLFLRKVRPTTHVQLSQKLLEPRRF